MQNKNRLRELEEILAENFANLEKEPDIQVQEAQRTPNQVNKSRSTPGHLVIKLVKYSDQGKILKAARQETVTYKGKLTRLAGDFSAEIFQAGRESHDLFKELKGENLQPRIFYPARISFGGEGEKKLAR